MSAKIGAHVTTEWQSFEPISGWHLVSIAFLCYLLALMAMCRESPPRRGFYNRFGVLCVDQTQTCDDDARSRQP